MMVKIIFLFNLRIETFSEVDLVGIFEKEFALIGKFKQGNMEVQVLKEKKEV